MVCVECRQANPDENVYCGRCGAELGKTVVETLVKRGIRDRKAVEYELTEAVADRLKKWGGFALGVSVLALGWSLFDIEHNASAAKAEIARSVENAKSDIEAERRSAETLAPQIADIQKNIESYRDTNRQIAKLQTDLKDVGKQVIDLGKRDLKANSIATTGPGPSQLQFGHIGCPTSITDAGMVVDYCVKGSPETLYQLTASGELKPVSSRSPIGFQDLSSDAKPSCDAKTRGTFYVEKGGSGQADEPFLCGKTSDSRYIWIPLLPRTGN